MTRNEITIRGEVFQVGFSFGAIKNFEEFTGKTIDKCQGTWDNLIFFWCTLRALNDNFKHSFNDFNTIMDSEPELLTEFVEITDKSNQSSDVKKKTEIQALFALWKLLPLLAVSPVLIPFISISVWIWTSLKLLIKSIKKAGKKRG